MHPDEVRRRIAGVVAIVPTPFDGDDRIDEAAFGGLLDRLTAGGVAAMTVNGNTGEFFTLSPAEAGRLVELAAGRTGDALFVAGVGFDPRTAVESARRARELGAHAVMVHPPVHPYVSPQGWVDHHVRIAGELAGLAVVPYLRDDRIGPAELAALADACPNVVAVKYAVPDPVRVAAVVRGPGADRFAWIAGLAESHAPAAAVAGTVGFTSGLAVVHPALSGRMQQALARADLPAAMRVWDEVHEFERLRAADRSADNVGVVKEALARIGLCRPDVRPPATRPAAPVVDAVHRIVDGWGLSATPAR
ncbi:dihydrodipicolinate synthase family protein [Pseudonocardia kongjuensis]|uniref:Dihydrodipicolinate synthase family protein n=1 Tax=Pseudonocardia kongjuensis TaxID=102227 RepID=A0ABP4IUA2_9PSEU